MAKDYYAILGVARGADRATVHHAFRTLARRFHPDTGNASSSEQFREVLEAYQALTDPIQQRQHDIDTNVGLARRERRSPAEPLFDPSLTAARCNPAYSNLTFHDLFTEVLRLFEAECPYATSSFYFFVPKKVSSEQSTMRFVRSST
jgi:DnaJ-class molecular chaperone